jgi:hypothetical protein
MSGEIGRIVHFEREIERQKCYTPRSKQTETALPCCNHLKGYRL